MKKLLVIFVLSIILFSLAGCGTVGPEDTIDKFFTAAQKLDLISMAENTAPSNTEDRDEILTVFEGEEQEVFPKSVEDYLKTNARKMTYEITGSEVNGDKAVVTVDCKYVDGGRILKATIGELFAKLFGQAFSGVEMTDEENDQMFLNVMEDQIKTLGETFIEVTLNIDLVKMKGTWYIAESSDELLDVAASGFISVIKEISDSFPSTDVEENLIDTLEGEILEENPVAVLTEIDNYVIGDLWNAGFWEIDSYLKTGTGGLGQEIDIDFTKSQLDKAMEKKAGCDEFIVGLDSSYSNIKEVWNKLSPEIDSLYQQIQSGAPSINVDLFTQYREAFSDLVNDFGGINNVIPMIPYF